MLQRQDIADMKPDVLLMLKQIMIDILKKFEA